MLISAFRCSSIQITPLELLGFYETNNDGKVQTIDKLGCVRVYCFPVEKLRQHQSRRFETNEEEVVNDWEELCEDNSVPDSSPAPSTDVIIRDRVVPNFDLLRGYVPIQDGGNLVGFKTTRDKTAVFEWMAKNFEKICCKDGSRLFDLDFSLDNGIVRRVMKSYFDDEQVRIGVILYKGTYHLFDFKVEEDEDERNNKLSFAGLRFEDFISRDINGRESEPSSEEGNNYNDSIKCYNVVRFSFGNNKILLRGEVDCVIPGSSAAQGRKPNVHDFIEIKTTNPYCNGYKTGRWFSQCILMGVKHIVVGIKREKGERIICDEIKAFTMEDLRSLSDDIWSEQKCFAELKKFLSLVKEKITEESSHIIHTFTFKEGVFSDMVKKNVSEMLQLPRTSEYFDLFDMLQRQM